MLKYCHTTILLRNVLPQSNSILNNNTIINYRNKTVSNPYTNLNALISRNTFPLSYSVNSYCYFSTINKKTFNKKQ